MKYSSLAQLKEDFQLKSNDLDIIRDNLNQLRVDLHPDRNNGKFKDVSEEEKYHKVNDAIEYIDNLKGNNQLMVVEKMADLVKVVAELIPNSKETSLQSKMDTNINFAIDHYKSRLFIPKLSLTAITAIMTFLFVIPSQIKDNPGLSKFLDPQSSVFIIIWLVMLLYTGLFWIMTFMNEEKAKRRLSLLKVDSTQNGFFDRFLKERELTPFTKDELTEYIFNNNTRGSHSLIFFGSDIITMEIAQGISEIIIGRAEKKGIIEKSFSNFLSDKFIVKNYA